MDGIGWAASAMAAARTRLDVAAQNVAGGSRDGFQKTRLQGFLNARGVTLRTLRDSSPGPLRRTGRDFDIAISGAGTFRLRDSHGGVTATRSGAFVRDRFERLTDGSGRVLLGSKGPVVVPQGATIEADGTVRRNGSVLNRIPLPAGSSLRSGFLESSNVDAIGEMIDVLTAERSFETAQKVLTAIDQTRERANTQVGALK